MPRHLLTSTPPNPDPRRGGPAGDDVNGADTAAAPKQHPKGPVRGRGALLALFAVLLVAWVGISGVGGPYFGKISEVATNDRSSFLPESAESTRAQDQIEKFSDLDFVPAIVVLENSDGVTDDDRSRLDELTKTLEDDDLLAADPSPAIPSDDGEALQLILPVSSTTTSDDVESIRDAVGKVFPTAVAADMTPDQAAEAPTTVADVHVTGPA